MRRLWITIVSAAIIAVAIACGQQTTNPTSNTIPPNAPPNAKIVGTWGANILRFTDPETGATCYVYNHDISCVQSRRSE